MPEAVEYIRRMRGGAQAHLLRCDDGGYYVVKFQNNPQGLRILANEMLGTRLAGRLGLPVPEVTVVEVPRDLIENSAELVIQVGPQYEPCSPGPQFGSRYPGNPAAVTVHDYIADEQLSEVSNLADFAGMLAFDKWTTNTNGRQSIFYREEGRNNYRAEFIDFGFCFNAASWNFPDAPLRGIYPRQRVYQSVTSLDSFEPWLGRIERFPVAEMGELAEKIPPDWYGGEYEAMEQLIDHMGRRRSRVRELIAEARQTYRQPFPNWI